MICYASESSSAPSSTKTAEEPLKWGKPTNQKLIQMMPNKREINTGGGNYYEASQHSENISGNKTVAQQIETVSYSLEVGISKEEFNELKESLIGLDQEQLAEIKKLYTQSENKDVAGKSIKSILVSQGVNIANGISASALFETVKLLLDTTLI